MCRMWGCTPAEGRGCVCVAGPAPPHTQLQERQQHTDNSTNLHHLIFYHIIFSFSFISNVENLSQNTSHWRSRGWGSSSWPRRRSHGVNQLVWHSSHSGQFESYKDPQHKDSISPRTLNNYFLILIVWIFQNAILYQVHQQCSSCPWRPSPLETTKACDLPPPCYTGNTALAGVYRNWHGKLSYQEATRWPFLLDWNDNSSKFQREQANKWKFCLQMNKKGCLVTS